MPTDDTKTEATEELQPETFITEDGAGEMSEVELQEVSGGLMALLMPATANGLLLPAVKTNSALNFSNVNGDLKSH